ncbi:hypothetical protein P4S93_17795 [Aneurinibacillus thermoaerophilus]|nr:hypothetical protein [Aneurinibacillus thermoaerophilus]MED0677328.1 hypothetical protein [Aneurinibacillus thermoaerophilus]MED0679085.1 hypothetical protein [Aneurinibacillus thermoaerophilus]MED0736608.1 hypothetical protein [Aneurinibacillus thermoaerophilus]MED0757898.1 hypothetical protein [Aneurinibacillus thermoaerophilus]MED0762585.1 hypothetical protein [Aneurinibacillus thermoaerophilus]
MPSVQELTNFLKALKSESPYVLLSETHIGNLQGFTKKCHEMNIFLRMK